MTLWEGHSDIHRPDKVPHWAAASSHTRGVHNVGKDLEVVAVVLARILPCAAPLNMVRSPLALGSRRGCFVAHGR